jgi:hypothetical protein
MGLEGMGILQLDPEGYPHLMPLAQRFREHMLTGSSQDSVQGG